MLRRIATASSLCVALFSAFALNGCSNPQARNNSYDPTAAEQSRDIQKAAKLYDQAMAVIDADPAAAQSLLTQALTADLYHGPAHNNLGSLLLNQGKLYDAAAEFEWACRLLPGMPQPRLNLGLALMRGDRMTQALEATALALEIQPGYLPAHQVSALIKVRSGTIDESLRPHLAAIISRSNDTTWTDWAKLQQMRLPVASIHGP